MSKKYIVTFQNKSTDDKRNRDYERLTIAEAFVAANLQKHTWGHNWEIVSIFKDTKSR